MSRLLTIVGTVLALSLAGADVAFGQTASRVIRLIDQRCANCHRDPGADRAPDVAGAPEPATLRQMAPETILQAITTGAMRVHAEGVADEVKRAMAEYMSARKLGDPAAGDARRMPNRCPAGPGIGDPSAMPAWHGWGPDATNARFQKACSTGRTSDRLKPSEPPGNLSGHRSRTETSHTVRVRCSSGSVFPTRSDLVGTN